MRTILTAWYDQTAHRLKGPEHQQLHDLYHDPMKKWKNANIASTANMWEFYHLAQQADEYFKGISNPLSGMVYVQPRLAAIFTNIVSKFQKDPITILKR